RSRTSFGRSSQGPDCRYETSNLCATLSNSQSTAVGTERNRCWPLAPGEEYLIESGTAVVLRLAEPPVARPDDSTRGIVAAWLTALPRWTKCPEGSGAPARSP